MKVVTVQQLSESLEACLTSVKEGEDVLVTDMGKPIVKLIAPPPAVETEEERMERLERQGIVRRGTGKLTEEFWNLPRGKPKEGCSVLDALLEERREGRCASWKARLPALPKLPTPQI